MVDTAQNAGVVVDVLPVKPPVWRDRQPHRESLLLRGKVSTKQKAKRPQNTPARSQRGREGGREGQKKDQAGEGGGGEGRRKGGEGVRWSCPKLNKLNRQPAHEDRASALKMSGD